MQKDFHYYTIFVLSNLSGFSQDEAKTIAYSSQYVDDCTDTETIYIGKSPFTITRTSYFGLDAFDKNVQKEVFISFHFIPPQPANGARFSYITQPDSDFLRIILDDAIRDSTELRLYRIGVALHGYADSWAHKNFSGRRSKENNITNLERRRNGSWQECKELGRLLVDLTKAHVGHLEAFKIPDICYENWRYTDYKGRMQIRENSEDFQIAARAILDKLSAINGVDPEIVWEQNQPKFKILFENKHENAKNKLEAQCNDWTTQFAQYFQSSENERKFIYDSNEWRANAMKLEEIEDFYKSDFGRFQRAASHQREFIMERLG